MSNNHDSKCFNKTEKNKIQYKIVLNNCTVSDACSYFHVSRKVNAGFSVYHPDLNSIVDLNSTSCNMFVTITVTTQFPNILRTTIFL